jgi:hypothetical protein
MPMLHKLRAVKSFLRNVFAREELGEARQTDAPPRAPRRPALATVFARERLPEDPPAPIVKRAGVLDAIFGREVLEEAPVPAPAPRTTGWLRMLFGSEPLDSPEEER